MEEYPEELRTPPITLTSMVGCPDLHPLISTYLLSQQPPINTLALPDLSKINVFSQKKTDPDSVIAASPPPFIVNGILKRDWLLKHRTKIPSVVAALFPSNNVFGDPSQWLQVCSDLDSIKSVIRARNIKLVVVLVHTNANDEVSEDRMIALRKRAELEAKYVVILNPNDDSEFQSSLNRLANIFSELSGVYYREEGRRVKQRIEKKNVSAVELIVRYCFKVAVYAEFRSDWSEALKFYEEAYHTLREIVGVTTRLPPIQRLVEIKSVSEQLHFKISTLLLHSGKVTEAVTWFRQHKSTYKRLVGAPEAILVHWEWMSRQYLVFGELLETSSKATQNFPPVLLGSSSKPLSEWEYYPAYYYQLAAHYLSEKRSALELATSMSEIPNEVDIGADSVVPSAYVGQFARLLEEGDNVDMLPLTDEGYTHYAISEGKRFRDSLEIIALLKKAYESYSGIKLQRMSSFCGFQMAKEYFAEGEIGKAKQMFDNIASLYRKEGWVTLLWDVLGYLRECSRKNGTAKDFVEYSLEMAALPISSDTGVQRDTGPAGPANILQREIVHKEVFELVGEAVLTKNKDSSNLKISAEELVQLEVDLVSPLRLVMFASVAFHEQTIKPGTSTSITISLLSHLPLTVEVDRLEIQFNQSSCNFFVTNAQKHHYVEGSDTQKQRTETAPSISLVSNKWLRLTYDIQSDQSGKLECLSVIAKIGSHLAICCRAESPASLDSLPLWTLEDYPQVVPIKDAVLVFSGQKTTQVEEPDPQVDLCLGASGPALIGEVFLVPVTLVSKGHAVYSGELKINLVDVKGGGLFSPRDSEPYSMESHHVQLLGISGPEGEDDSQLDSDKIKKIQQSFGLISVPFIKNGDSWSCKLEIKWHRPKPIMLYVSLGYKPNGYEPNNAQTVHVHKNLQIEGNNAIVINHHYLMPFRRDPLLLSKNKEASESDQPEPLPSNQNTILVVSAKNCTEVPLRLKSISIEEEDGVERTCSIQHGNEELSDPALLVPGEEFKKVFSVSSNINISKLRLGTACLKWRRDFGVEEKSASTAILSSWVVTKQKLPDMNVELPPLIVSLECPPYAILGDPFTYYIRILNQTQLLQEIKYSLADAQSFVLCGYHNDTVYVLPKSEHIVSYKLVPLASGMQQLPRFSMTSVRYSAAYQPSNSSNTVFVFPSKPHFKTAASPIFRVEESVANE